MCTLHANAGFTSAVTTHNVLRLLGISWLSGSQQLIEMLQRVHPCWQSLLDPTAHQLLMALIMLIERQVALAEVLPWLWPLADGDSDCMVDVPPELQMRLLTALMGIPEALDNTLGGKVRLQSCCNASCNG